MLSPEYNLAVRVPNTFAGKKNLSKGRVSAYYVFYGYNRSSAEHA